MPKGEFESDYKHKAHLQKGFNAILIEDFVQYVLRTIPDAKTRPLKIIDLCCGDGGKTRALLEALEEAGVQIACIVGVDISEQQIQVATQDHTDCKKLAFLCGDVANLSFNNEFDLGLSLFGLHWLPDINVAARSIHQVLKPSGQLMFFVPLEKQDLFAYRTSLVSSEAWGRYFSQFRLQPFHDSVTPYAQAFNRFFIPENTAGVIALSQRVDFDLVRFKEFLSSWIQELRHLPLEVRGIYLDQLINCLPGCFKLEEDFDKNLNVDLYRDKQQTGDSPHLMVRFFERAGWGHYKKSVLEKEGVDVAAAAALSTKNMGS